MMCCKTNQTLLQPDLKPKLDEEAKIEDTHDRLQGLSFQFSFS